MDHQVTQNTPTCYVGIGASAGGLEALQQFFKGTHPRTGAAYVVIQHLAPDYKSMMDELLARYTDMPIYYAQDGLVVQRDCIYLIPPAHNLTIYHGKLFLQMQQVHRGLNLPVDIFLRSLAADQESRAVAVILSGTGSDGTLGIKAVKEVGGMIMVQDESSAKFNGMPRNAIDTGIADYILPAERMGEALLTYLNHPLVTDSGTSPSVSMSLDTMSKILVILRESSKIDFSFYKENTIARRIERRISVRRCATIEEYLHFLEDHDEEKEILFNDLLIGVTRFFRDSEAFKEVAEKVLPHILIPGASVRIWSTGCSTGEEVYSLAIVCLEYIRTHNIDCSLKLFATDIDKRSLEIASQGYYPSNIVADIEPDLLSRYFVPRDEGYQVSEEVRRLVVFAMHNILKDPPFSRVDLLVCRNLFIYFTAEVQQRLLAMFYYALVPTGYLFMGSSESIGEMSEAFTTIHLKWKLYRKDAKNKPTMSLNHMNLPLSDVSPSSTRLAGQVIGKGHGYEKILEAILSSTMPPSVLVDDRDNIIHVINSMHDFMEIRSGRFSQNLLGNLPQDLSLFVNNILRRLKDGDTIVEFEHITGLRKFPKQVLSVVGRTVPADGRNYYHLSFTLTNESAEESEAKQTSVDVEVQVSKRIQELERSLQLTKENLQATVEELETSNEELQSSNEELIASNEELQSTNEELQAVNEELYSVNAEYQQKIDDLIRSTNDMDNLLKNTDIGALYLDINLCIRRMTPSISRVANIYASDIGRPITHFTFRSNTPDLLEDIRQVTETLENREREIADDEGITYLVRIRPYRTNKNAVDGIILVFIDITQLKRQEQETQVVRDRMENAMQVGQMAWWMWDTTKDIFTYDPMLSRMLGLSSFSQLTTIEDVLSLMHEDDRPQCVALFSEFKAGKQKSGEVTVRLQSESGPYLWFLIQVSTGDEHNSRTPRKLFGTITNITQLRHLENELQASEKKINDFTAWSSLPRAVVDASGLIQFMSSEAASIWNQPAQFFIDKSFDSLFEPIETDRLMGPFASMQAHKESEVQLFSIASKSVSEVESVLVQGFYHNSDPSHTDGSYLFIMRPQAPIKR